MKSWLLLIAMLAAANAYGHDVARAVFGDQKTLAMFTTATDVTAERLFLKKSADGVMIGNPWHFQSYSRGNATAVPEAVSKELRQLLIEQSSYLWHFDPKNGRLTQMKACAPDYGVLVTFRGSAGVVSIAFCFQCDLFAVFYRNGDDAIRVNVEEDFDLIRPQLVALVKRLFPQDPDIQKLKPVHSGAGT